MTDGQTDGQTDRRTDGFTIASTALTAMLTRCKNVESVVFGDDVNSADTEDAVVYATT